MIVVCRQVVVSATGRSLVERNPTEYDVSLCNQETSRMRLPWPALGCCAREEEKEEELCETLTIWRANNRKNLGVKYTVCYSKYYKQTWQQFHFLYPHSPTLWLHLSSTVQMSVARKRVGRQIVQLRGRKVNSFLLQLQAAVTLLYFTLTLNNYRRCLHFAMLIRISVY
jgi:hypothetical protein